MAAPDLQQIHLVTATFLECCISSADDSGRVVERIALPEQAWLFPQFTTAEKRISYIVHVNCQGLCPEGEPTGVAGRFQLYFDFQVDNLDEHLATIEATSDPIPTHEMMVMLGGVAYSTARGMLLSKVQDTPLHGFSLPLRWPVELLEASVKRMIAEQNAQEKPVLKKPAKPRARKKS
ncbi:hypothetical protein LRS06_02645 [Hymenobacter sp. J193]|uniref:hypothetical protein n=1 Tax=Hymenobacter sp. J193 TaxID=2898429 RepID=UPI002150C028|nr:hypothetical protein [Hymenobacter sp. J193]MCR5886690.1 hypothetical protein [Hymenobacter sp. J193]